MQPAWLTEQVFSEKIQPALAKASPSAIAKRISVSRWYAGRIREGYRPHPRHWLALAGLTGTVPGVSSVSQYALGAANLAPTKSPINKKG